MLKHTPYLLKHAYFLCFIHYVTHENQLLYICNLIKVKSHSLVKLNFSQSKLIKHSEIKIIAREIVKCNQEIIKLLKKSTNWNICLIKLMFAIFLPNKYLYDR